MGCVALPQLLQSSYQNKLFDLLREKTNKATDYKITE